MEHLFVCLATYLSNMFFCNKLFNFWI